MLPPIANGYILRKSYREMVRTFEVILKKFEIEFVQLQ